ncbi:MAG: HK97-gp10 family putative phage morphogenesis protein [Providencia sp.]
MRISAKVSGLSDLGEALSRLEEEIKVKILRNAGKKAMEPVLDDMKRNAGFDETSQAAHMRDSIKISTTNSKKLNGSVLITVGPSNKHFIKAFAQEMGTIKQVSRPFKQLDGKFDKTGGTVGGSLNVTGLITARDGTIQAKAAQAEGYIQIATSVDGAEAMLNSKRTSTPWRKHSLPDSSGTIMQVGDYGFGKSSSSYITTDKIADYRINSIAYAEGNKGDSFLGVNNHLLNVFGFTSSTHGYQLNFAAGSERVGFRSIANNVVNSWKEFYTTANTTKDSNGNLKAASPIIKVFADHIELNEESEGVELEKLSTGRYKLKGTLGMNSDASWGGYHGGLVIPNGINNLPLVWADFKVEADGDIIIETHYRKHADLPPPVVLNRLITYPEFMDVNGNELESYTPCDIPNGHWIDVRVNMPSDSLYNQKQAEAQRLAEIEAERLAKEEAERIAEEAEKAKLEAIEQTAE